MTLESNMRASDDPQGGFALTALLTFAYGKPAAAAWRVMGDKLFYFVARRDT